MFLSWLFMYVLCTQCEYCYKTHVICKKTHILSNDSQLCNRWATKYPFFVITRGYVTHSKLWFDMTTQYTSKLYCAKISFLMTQNSIMTFIIHVTISCSWNNLIKSSIRHSKVGLVNVLLHNNFVLPIYLCTLYINIAIQRNEKFT